MENQNNKYAYWICYGIQPSHGKKMFWYDTFFTPSGEYTYPSIMDIQQTGFLKDLNLGNNVKLYHSPKFAEHSAKYHAIELYKQRCFIREEGVIGLRLNKADKWEIY